MPDSPYGSYLYDNVIHPPVLICVSSCMSTRLVDVPPRGEAMWSDTVRDIEILDCSRLESHHRYQVADGLMESLIEIKDSKGVRRNVGVISGQVEVFWVEPGPQLVGIGRIEWLGERGLDGAIGHTQEFDQTCVPKVALERDQPLICRPLNMANVPENEQDGSYILDSFDTLFQPGRGGLPVRENFRPGN